MRQSDKISIAFMLSATLSHQACATGLAVKPIRIDLSQSAGHSNLAVSNEGEAPVQVRISVLGWTQRDNLDVLDPTSEINLSPTMAILPPGGTIPVSVDLKSKSSDAAGSYRVVVEELPEAPAKAKPIVGMLLKVSVPIFVEPAGEPKLRWALYPQNNRAVIEVRNDGFRHVQVLRLSFLDGAGSVVFDRRLSLYVLPKSVRIFNLESEPAVDFENVARVVAATDQGEIETSLKLSGKTSH